MFELTCLNILTPKEVKYNKVTTTICMKIKGVQIFLLKIKFTLLYIENIVTFLNTSSGSRPTKIAIYSRVFNSLSLFFVLNLHKIKLETVQIIVVK